VSEHRYGNHEPEISLHHSSSLCCGSVVLGLHPERIGVVERAHVFRIWSRFLPRSGRVGEKQSPYGCSRLWHWGCGLLPRRLYSQHQEREVKLSHADSYSRMFAGALSAAEFVAFTQLITKPRSELLPLQFAAIALFAVSLPLLVEYFLRPPSAGQTPNPSWADAVHFGLFFISIAVSLAGLDLLFWSVSCLSGGLFLFACAFALYVTFRLHKGTSRPNTPAP
jgi:hypothetical protein